LENSYDESMLQACMKKSQWNMNKNYVLKIKIINFLWLDHSWYIEVDLFLKVDFISLLDSFISSSSYF
jgi:hypothetical protein